MTMEKLKKCRICLVENVRMNVVADKTLQDIYEKLTDVPFVTEDSRPNRACFVCCEKLKQCYQLQRKCLEAEELFTQMLNGDYEIKPLINEGLFHRGINKTSTDYISIVDECQTESITIKEELPAVCKELDDIIEPKEEHQRDELELENFNSSCLDVADIRPHCSESDLEDDVPLMEIKIEVEEEQELPAVCEGLDNMIEPKEEHQSDDELEMENFNNSYLDVVDIRPHHSESDSEDDVPLMEFKTEVEEEREVFTMKQRSGELKRATVVKKLKLDTRRTNLEDAKTAEGATKAKSDSKVLRTKRTSKPASIFKEPYKYDQPHLKPKGDLRKHIRQQTGEKPYKCDLCPRSFSVKCSLLRHIRMHTGDVPYKCDICQRNFSDQCVLMNHVRIHSGEKPFKCDICQSSFRQNVNLKRHMRVHTGEKPYVCDVCQRSFSEKGSLLEHIPIHTGEKPYMCNVCQRSFCRKSNLRQHIRIHTRVKPYKCDVCQQTFSEQDNLSQHILIHIGESEKPYKCEICPRSFNEKGSLKKHIRIHTGEKPFKCDVCQRGFIERGSLTKHIRVHTGEKPFKCDKCESSFRQICHLKRHHLTHT